MGETVNYRGHKITQSDDLFYIEGWANGFTCIEDAKIRINLIIDKQQRDKRKEEEELEEPCYSSPFDMSP